MERPTSGGALGALLGGPNREGIPARLSGWTAGTIMRPFSAEICCFVCVLGSPWGTTVAACLGRPAAAAGGGRESLPEQGRDCRFEHPTARSRYAFPGFVRSRASSRGALHPYAFGEGCLRVCSAGLRSRGIHGEQLRMGSRTKYKSWLPQAPRSIFGTQRCFSRLHCIGLPATGTWGL